MRFSIWPSPDKPLGGDARDRPPRRGDRVGRRLVRRHFMPNDADTSGPTSEAWTTIAALAAAVPRVRIGTLVTGNTL